MDDTSQMQRELREIERRQQLREKLNPIHDIDFGKLNDMKAFIISQARASTGHNHPGGTFDVVTSNVYCRDTLGREAVPRKTGVIAQLIVYANSTSHDGTLLKKSDNCDNLTDAFADLLHKMQHVMFL